VTLKRPVMRFHGGKWRMAGKIIACFPAHKVYAEPFGGGASVLLQKPRSHGEIYNDLDDEVWTVFHVLQIRYMAEELERRLRVTPFSRREFELCYEPTSDPVERARRMIARSFMGYGTTAATRPGRTGFRAAGFQQRTPSAIEWARYPDEIRLFTERLQGVTLENRPALGVIAGLDAQETLYYCDPPYPFGTRSSCRDKRKHFACEMTDSEHEELATALHGIRGMAIISGYQCPLYDRLYGDWARLDFGARSMKNVARVESLWLSPRISALQIEMGES
jgi:DNA adenine methylase